MRGVLALFLLLGLLFVAPPAASAQPAKVHRVGVVQGAIPAFQFGGAATLPWLAELGYVEGQNIRFEKRFSVGGDERLPELAAELVRLKVDVIVSSGGPAIRAVKQATKTIPVVMVSDVDPVRAGLVATLARPGGNITGVSTLRPELAGKRLEILKDAVPELRRVAVIWNPTAADRTAEWKDMEAAGRLLNIELQSLEVRRREDAEPALEAAVRQRAGALIVLADRVTWGQAKMIGDLAAKHRLATVYEQLSFLRQGEGGLIFYGPSEVDISRRVAAYVDKILRGAKPADLPIEQPTRFELIVNRKGAQAIGLKLPQSFLLRADSVLD